MASRASAFRVVSLTARASAFVAADLASRASAFVAHTVTSRASAFIAAPAARASAFIASDPTAVPTDYTVSFAADCSEVTVTVNRDWTAETNVAITVRPWAGPSIAAVPVDVTADAAIIRFTPPADGHYLVLVSSSTGPLYRAPVLAYCRALRCLRDLNRDVATGGRGGQAQGPSDAWRQVYARTRLAIAASATIDYGTAHALLGSIAPYCAHTTCGC